MSTYNDMANDAGCHFGTDENRQMAEMIEAGQLPTAKAVGFLSYRIMTI